VPIFQTPDKVRLYFKDWGDGAPIIFLHAYASLPTHGIAKWHFYRKTV
jgi:hypothetical protein